MPSAETQADYEDFSVAENETEQRENQEQDVEEDSSDDESRFDAAGCVSLIYKVEMEDKKGIDLPINIFSLICTPYTVDFTVNSRGPIQLSYTVKLG